MMKSHISFTVLLILFSIFYSNHGSIIMPGSNFAADLVFQDPQDSDVPKFDKESVSKLIESPYFRKTLLPFYLEEILQKLTNSVDDLFVGVQSRDCKGNMMQLFELLTEDNFNITTLGRYHLWTLHMVDSWAKPPEGILSGHINPMGDFDECVGIKARDTINKLGKVKDFNGRYCTVYVYPKPTQDRRTVGEGNNDTMSISATSPEHLLSLMAILEGVIVLPTMGVCFPDTCSQPDIRIILENGFKLLGFNPGVAAPTIDNCYVEKKPDFDAGDISVITLLSLLGFTCLFTGIIDIVQTRGAKKKPARSLAMQYLMAFSFYNNINKWLSTNSGGDDLGCVHGIRFLSTCWVILAHTWYMVTFIPLWNMVDMKLVHEDWSIMLVINSTVSVDTFFVLSGLLVCYAVMKTLDKQKGSLNIPLFYVHRYLRLTPTYALLIAMMATVFPYFGSGPFWRIMDRWSNICENNWWTNLLYVNNFVNDTMLCQGEAWYLANDFQFYVFSPLIIYPLWKWSSIGIALLIVSTVASILCPGLLVNHYGIAPTTIGTRDIQTWFLEVYIKPWSRAQTYLVGMAFGYMLYKTKGKKVNIPKLVQLICWCLSTATCLAVLFGMQPYFDPLKPIPKTTAFFFAALNRFGWACSVGWIIFACVKGYGGMINSFLSWSAFMPLGRLCFCAFLVSLHLQMVLHLSFRQAISYDLYTMVNLFFAHLVMSFAAAFVCTITMESPFIIISKLMFEGGTRVVPQFAGIAKPASNERYGIFYSNPDTVINTDRPSEGIAKPGPIERNGIFYNNSNPDTVINTEKGKDK